MDFEEFTLVATASRQKTSAQMQQLSPRQQKKLAKNRAKFDQALVRLEYFAERSGNELRDAVMPVITSLKALKNAPQFQKDKRDKEILRAVAKVLSVNTRDFEDVKIRYIADCQVLADKIERRVNGALEVKGGYILTRAEKKERAKRLKEEQQQLELLTAKEAVKQYTQQVLDTQQAIELKKQQIASENNETKAILLLREIKQHERYIAQRQNLIELNQRVVQLIETQRFQSDMDKLLNQADCNKQLKLIEQANKLYKKELVSAKLAQHIQTANDKLVDLSISKSELNEVKALKQQSLKSSPLSSPITQKQTTSTIFEENIELEELLEE